MTARAPDLQDITRVHQVPEQVAGILKTSCYDCHSNHTYYPWYARIQPVAIWLNDHIEEGKGELNFRNSVPITFAASTVNWRRSMSRSKRGNALSSHTIIHRDAKLSKEQKLAVVSMG